MMQMSRRIVVGAAWAAMLFFGAWGAPHQSAEAAEKAAGATALFKRSTVAAWFDGPDDHKVYDVDVMVQEMDLVTEQEIPKWRAFVRRMHEQGKRVCAEFRPLTHMGRMLEYVMNEPGMQAAVCVDFDLKPIRIPWMGGHLYEGRWPHFYCSNHPRYREYLRQQIYMFCEAGVDGIMVDDGGGTFFAISHGGCFCPYCMSGFREYLKGKYTVEQLRQRGVDDPDTFDYRQFLLRSVDTNAAYREARKRGTIPFNAEFHDFLVQSDVSLFESLQEMACKLRSKYIPMGWDNVDFQGSRAPYYGFLGVFYSEITYQNFAVEGRGPDEKFPPAIVFLYKLSDALDKGFTPTPGPRSWGTIRDKNLTGLLRLWVAFSYANGGVLRYPRKGWCFSETAPWYYPPKDEFEPLYAFVREHRDLFDDYEAVEQVGVLFTQSDQGGLLRYSTPMKHVCSRLVDLNVPFGMAVAGDERLRRRLAGDEAHRFEILLIPEPIRLIDGQEQIVQQWKRENRAVAVRPGDNVAEILQGRVRPVVSLDTDSPVWLFPRQIPGKKDAPRVCHVVNFRYDAQSNRTVPQTNVRVVLRSPFWHGRPGSKITFHAPGKEPLDLPGVRNEDSVQVIIPEMDLWGVLSIGP